MKFKSIFRSIILVVVMAALMTGCSNINPNISIEITGGINKGIKGMDLREVSSVELMKYLGNGINLGNTMEAVNSNYGKKLDTSKYETCWGQPVTTREMIDAMKAGGFDTLRIPVAWTNMMDYENDDYTIDSALTERVAQIVDWALDADMFVIVNDHWDGGWWDMFANDKQVKKAWKIYESIWSQVGDRFKDYPDTLILESANEELGAKWEQQGMKKDAAYTLMNEVNQRFVDIIRAQGHSNANRFLLIAGSETNIDKTVDDRFIMPTDTATNKLIVSVHYYDPWNYCGDKSADKIEDLDNYRWGLKSEYEHNKTQLGKLTKFIDNGYGVILGEYGALCCYIGGKSYEIPNAVDYNRNILDLCDIYGICPVLWDCNNAFNKKTLSFISDDMRDLYSSRNTKVELKDEDAYLIEVQNRLDKLTNEALDEWSN